MNVLLRKSFVVGLATVFLFGCALLKKKKADAGADDEPPIENAPTVTVTGSGAKNEKDVLRYAKEEKVANEASTIAKDGTKVRTFPGTGAEVATLSKGTGVVKIAKYFSTGVVITFNDPSGDGSKLMGWVPPEALVVVTTPTTPTTPTAVPTAPKPVVFDAGAPKDAGAAADAGASKDAGAPVDAGALPVPGKATLAVPPVGDKCPAGFALVSPMCRRTCNADTDCPRTTFCVAGGGKKYCSTTK